MRELLKLSRECLECNFNRKKPEVSEEIKEKYSAKKACFVTLTENGELRGCIGSLSANQELWKEVIDNSINAGFHDPRFLPLSLSELNKIKIEISVLSVPKIIFFENEKELTGKIDKNMGLILKNGFYSSTFLPQVWGQIPDKIKFLEHLSRKAGLNKNAWKDAEIWYYRAEKIKEE